MRQVWVRAERATTTDTSAGAGRNPIVGLARKREARICVQHRSILRD
jgi:hypothetical protein